mmetsp:Transcript_5602/g.13149  ORF Transcript_5602/g.13149 Transcript_5602/m.13149 type:complete len:287 (-) Transcript_5602:491-1351(-)
MDRANERFQRQRPCLGIAQFCHCLRLCRCKCLVPCTSSPASAFAFSFGFRLRHDRNLLRLRHSGVEVLAELVVAELAEFQGEALLETSRQVNGSRQLTPKVPQLQQVCREVGALRKCQSNVRTAWFNFDGGGQEEVGGVPEGQRVTGVVGQLQNKQGVGLGDLLADCKKLCCDWVRISITAVCRLSHEECGEQLHRPQFGGWILLLRNAGQGLFLCDLVTCVWPENIPELLIVSDHVRQSLSIEGNVSGHAGAGHARFAAQDRSKVLRLEAQDGQDPNWMHRDRLV